MHHLFCREECSKTLSFGVFKFFFNYTLLKHSFYYIKWVYVRKTIKIEKKFNRKILNKLAKKKVCRIIEFIYFF